MQADKRIERCRGAFALLPQTLREAESLLPGEELAAAEELRLRAGQPLAVVLPWGERPVGRTAVSPGDLEQLLDNVTGYSRYTAAETVRQGYLTAAGGYRIGLCGTAVVERGAFIRSTLLEGVIGYAQEQPLLALQPGRIARVHVQQGQRVSAGELLVSMDTEAQEQELAAVTRMLYEQQEAAAAFGQAAARLEEVGRELGEAISIQRTDIFDAMHRI